MIADAVLIEYESITLLDIFGNSHPRRLARKFSPAATETAIVKYHLFLGAILDHVKKFVDLRVMPFATFLPGSMGKHHDIFAIMPPPLIRSGESEVLFNIVCDAKWRQNVMPFTATNRGS